MQFIYYLTIGVTLSLAGAQLLYTDPTRDDGPCQHVTPVSLLNSNLVLYNPLATYYVPFASENFFRYEFQMATNQPATTEDDVTSLQTRVKFLQIRDLLSTVSDIQVYFFNDTSVYYTYRGLPSISVNPLFDLTATAVHGSSGSGPSGLGGNIDFTVIWNDNSPAWTVYTCVGGRQMFHVVSGATTLTAKQLDINRILLTGLGFNTDNFQYLNYSN
ncbi:hypothetical protein HA402_015567 [Bradysia odoriphaga]|nr:hypothetical protein HA402_015567 [Bradysia odoriphaga]